MLLHTRYVGMRSRPLELAVTPRWAMNYAAAVNDPNPRYFNDEAPEQFVAPPMLATALTWQIAGRFDEFWDTTDFPSEVMQRQVHFSEVLRWDKPLRPGTTLTLTGEVAAILPHRAGTHFIVRFDAHDPEGERVFHEYIGGLLRDVSCEGERQGGDSIPEPKRFPEPARPEWEEIIPISKLAAHQYDGGADIHFPIHTSRAFAHSVGLPDIIYHGTATLAQALREIVDREANGDPTALLEVRCMFTDTVALGSNVALRVWACNESEEGTEVLFTVVNDGGRAALRRGSALLRRPGTE